MDFSYPIHWLFEQTGILTRLAPYAGFPVLYLLGLAAAGLLAIRKDWRNGVIVTLLAGLWAWLPLGYHRFAPPGENLLVHGVIELLAVLQVLLFLEAGLIKRAVRFKAQAGHLWTVLGSGLLAYSLLVHPLLGALTRRDFDGEYIAGLPFPPLVFTLGLLFLLAEPVPRRVLVIPLLGTAIGGIPGAPLDAAHLWALRIAFVAGCLFAFLPREAWGGRGRRRELYEAVRRGRSGFQNALLALVLAVLTLLVFWQKGAPFDPVLERFTVSLGVLAIAGVVLWLAFPAWLSPAFRSLAWPVAQGMGRLWSRFRSAWKWIVLLLVAVILLDYAVRQITEDKVSLLKDLVTLSTQQQAWFVTSAVFFWLVYLFYQGRRRLVIQAFEDHTGNKDLEPCVKGLHTQLRNDLARISELYEVIDEASPRLGNVVMVSAGVQDVGDILQESAGANPAKFFGLELPTNLIFSLIGRLVKGPRLSGSVLGKDGDILIVAELSGGGMRASWRVDASKLDEGDRDLPAEARVRKMTEQLAFRVATNVVSIGSPRWRAVRCFTEGLRLYRETRRTAKDRDLNLRKAEACFLDAAKEDDQFTQSHYNLGVVYRHLRELDSARSAFRRALRGEKDRRFDTCYALAETDFEDRDFEEAVWFCDSAINIDPADARAWDLKAFSSRQLKQQRKGLRVALSEDDPAWQEILPIRQIAVALAWRRFCRAVISNSSLEQEKGAALLSTRNLAVVLARMGYYGESEKAFRETLRLAEHDPDLLFNLGKVLYTNADWAESKAILAGVFDEGGDMFNRASRWAALSRIYTQCEPVKGSRKEAEKEARRAFKGLLDIAASAKTQEEIQDLADALADCLERPEKSRFRTSRDERNDLAKALRAHEGSEALLERLWQAYETLAALGLGNDGTGEGWLRSLLCFRDLLGNLGNVEWQVLEEPKPNVDRRHFQQLQKALMLPKSDGARSAASLRQLRGLANTLGELLRKGDEDPGAYLDRQHASPPVVPAQERWEEDSGYRQRKDFHEAALRALGLKLGGRRGDVLRLLMNLKEALAEVLQKLARSSEPSPEVERTAADLLKECLEDALLGWEWAYCQVKIKLAREILLRGSARKLDARQAGEAEDCLKEAIQRLEVRGFSQPREQGLYGLLAQATLTRAETCSSENGTRVELLRDAFAYARHAAGINPEGAQDRVSLVRVYSALGDYEQAKAESKICIARDGNSEILRIVGACFWTQAAATGRRATRKAVLREAVSFFKQALGQIESQAFEVEKPLEQMDSHAWGHYWLGRFCCELLEHETGTAHQEIAHSMGFKPLESLANLGQAYLETRDFNRAQKAFAAAEKEAGRWRWPNLPQYVADSPGEERPVDELLFEVYLGQASLHIERGLAADGTEPLVRRAEALLSNLDPFRQSACRAALHETLAWIHLQAGQTADSEKEARRSLELSARSGAYLCLAKALLESGPSDEKDRQAIREACRRSLSTDTRGLYRRETRLLLARLGEQGSPGPSSPADLGGSSSKPAKRSPADGPPGPAAPRPRPTDGRELR